MCVCVCALASFCAQSTAPDADPKIQEIEDVYPEDPEQLEEAVPQETEVAT